MGVRFQTKTLRLQRDGSAPGEWVKKSERFIAHVFSDFRTGRFQYFLIIGVFPLHQLGQQRVQPLPFFFLLFFCRKQLRMG